MRQLSLPLLVAALALVLLAVGDLSDHACVTELQPAGHQEYILRDGKAKAACAERGAGIEDSESCKVAWRGVCDGADQRHASRH